MKQVEVVYIISPDEGVRNQSREHRVEKYTKLLNTHTKSCGVCRKGTKCGYYNAFVTLIDAVMKKDHDESPGTRVFKYHQDWDTFREV